MHALDATGHFIATWWFVLTGAGTATAIVAGLASPRQRNWWRGLG